MNSRSDGKPCDAPFGYNPKSGTLCPDCKDNDYEMTTMGSSHNYVYCACGWRGCECELLIGAKEDKETNERPRAPGVES